MDGAAADATGGGDGVFEGVWEVEWMKSEKNVDLVKGVWKSCSDFFRKA